MTSNNQVSPVIRISQENRDVSARATHLEAANGKFLLTTNERKQMSTKTNFKRIALVAVAALGLGVLSSVPSNAVGNLSVTVTNGSFSASKADSTNAATIAISAAIENITDTITITAVPNGTLGDSVNVTTAGARLSRLIYLDTTTAARSKVGTVVSGLLTTTDVTTSKLDSQTTAAGTGYTLTSPSGIGNVGATFGIQVDSVSSAVVAGTYSFTVFVKQYTQGVAVPVTTSYTVSLVAAAPATSSTTAVGTYNFANLSSTSISAGASSTSDEVISALATAGTTRAYLFVANRNAANGSATALDSLTATVTGVGLVCTSAGTTCGKSIKIAATGDYQFLLQGDGNGGTSTITVTSSVAGNSYVKSLTYYAAAAKTLTASVLTPVLAIGSNDSAVAVTAVDATGAVWGGTAYIYASTATDATTVGGSNATPVACVFRAANNTHYCPITAVAAGTGKFKVIDASTVALATATSNEVTVTSSVGTPATVKLSFNKASYAPGETGYILITPLDAAGKALPSATTANVLASGGITSNVGLTYNAAAVTLTGTSVTPAAYSGSTSVAGSQAIFFNAPLSGGTISLTAKGGTGLPAAGQVALSASATVTNDAASALAAVTALATTVASLKTLITTLTNLVLKIQKKVKA